MSPEKNIIGFIGLGVMGASMAGHLMKAGYRMNVHTRTRAKAESLIGAGAVWRDDAASVARESDLVFTMLGYPSDVESVYFGSGGIIENARSGSILVDTTTSSPALAARIYATAKKAGLGALDAPVSGGDVGAKNATLTIMVGGDESDFETAKPLFALMGTTVIRQGDAGAGQHTKMANQIAIAGNLMGAVEAVTYARSAGLDPRSVLLSIASGSAGSWQLSTMVPRMLDGNFAPGFYVKHFLKDLRIAVDSARAMNVRLPMLDLAESLFAALKDGGFGENGTHALYLLYERGLT
jgi:3-hydroxyisobutyrate dehydrogenase